MSGLTDQERLSVVKEAIRLIKSPINFVQGNWKCALYRDKTGKLCATPHDFSQPGAPLQPSDWKPELDDEGRPVFSYCIEGAVNQAGINMLGLQRAIDLGAAIPGIKKWGEPEVSHTSTFIDNLSVNDVARVLYAKLFKEGDPDYDESPPAQAAQIVNDFGYEDGDLEDDELERVKETAHERVLEMLRKRARQLTTG